MVSGAYAFLGFLARVGALRSLSRWLRELSAISSEVPVLVIIEASWASSSTRGCGVARGGIVLEGSGMVAKVPVWWRYCAPKGRWDLTAHLFAEQ